MDLEYLKRAHQDEMHKKDLEFQKKQQQDDEKYKELNKLKLAQVKEFEDMITEQCTWQEQQRKKMKQEHENQKEEKDKEFKNLQETLKNMIEQNKRER
jgi:hypothetical protein